jgi:hypothetical protein
MKVAAASVRVQRCSSRCKLQSIVNPKLTGPKNCHQHEAKAVARRFAGDELMISESHDRACETGDADMTLASSLPQSPRPIGNRVDVPE